MISSTFFFSFFSGKQLFSQLRTSSYGIVRRKRIQCGNPAITFWPSFHSHFHSLFHSTPPPIPQRIHFLHYRFCKHSRYHFLSCTTALAIIFAHPESPLLFVHPHPPRQRIRTPQRPQAPPTAIAASSLKFPPVAWNYVWLAAYLTSQLFIIACCRF